MVYTVAQVASILHVNKNYVYELIDKGMIPVLKFKSFRIRKSSLEKFLENTNHIRIMISVISGIQVVYILCPKI